MTNATAIDTRTTPGSLVRLLDSWELSLRAERKSPKTIKNYLGSAERLVAFLTDRGMPTKVASIRREHVEAFLVETAETLTASTAATRFRCLQQLWRWLREEGEIETSPMANMRPPKVPDSPVPVLSEEQLRALLTTCKGRAFDARRDLVIIVQKPSLNIRATPRGDLTRFGIE
jgi:site-specific recombinase XerD